MQVPKRKSEQAVKRDSGPLLVTKKALDDMSEQVIKLEESLPELIKEVERTKAHGDFSENAAYQHAKYMLRSTQGRIARIKGKIKRAVLIKKKKNSDTVNVGSVVVVELKGEQYQFEILGSHEADPSGGRISNVSPLGKLLIGHSVGDEVVLNLNDQTSFYKIIEIQ